MLKSLPNMLPPTAARPPILTPAKKPTGPPRQVPRIAPAIGYTFEVENPSLLTWQESPIFSTEELFTSFPSWKHCRFRLNNFHTTDYQKPWRKLVHQDENIRDFFFKKSPRFISQKKYGRWPKKKKKKMEADLKKKKKKKKNLFSIPLKSRGNGRRPQKNKKWKTTSKK
jgi:hypothetical protein